MRFNVINFKKVRTQSIKLLPDKGILKIPDTTTYTLAKEINRMDAESFLTGSSVGRVLGIEWLIIQGKAQCFMFMPSTELSTLPVKETIRPFISTDDYKEMDCYNLDSNKSSCFPFRMNSKENLIEHVIKYTDKKLKDEQIFIQLLISKKSNWQENLRQQYNDYLEGIELPTSNKIVRDIQYKILNFIKTKDEWIGQNPIIDAAEDKFKEDGFRICLRFAVYGGSRESRDYLAQRIKLGFSHLNYANNWIQGKVSAKKVFLENLQLRRFPMTGEQILCVSELLPFFCGDDGSIIKSAPLNAINETKDVVRLSFKLPTLNSLPTGKLETHQQDYSKFEDKINKTLEKIGLLKDDKVKVNDIQQGATVQRITFSLPSGINFSAFNEKVNKDIKSHLGKDISVVMGSIPNTVAITIPLEKRQKVYLRDLIDTEEFRRFAKDNPLPIIVGVDEVGKIILACLTKMPHLLTAGATGSGKSVWLNCVLLTILLTKTPDEVSIVIADPKQVEFVAFEDFPHVQKVVTNPSEVPDILESLTAEMTRRYAMFAELKCKNIKQYNTKSNKPLKYIVCIIDEFSELVMSVPEVKTSVMRLGQLARACGIDLIVATQRPSVEVIDGDIKAQLPARISFKCSSMHDYKTVLDLKPPYELLGRGDGVAYGFDGLDGLTRFQGALIADGDEAADDVISSVLDEWTDILKGTHVTEDKLPEVIKKPIPSLLEKAKFIIYEEKKVTQRSLSKALEIRYEKVKPILDELVEEEWVESPLNNRSGYKVIIDQSEMKTFGIWFRDTFESQYWGINFTAINDSQ